MCGIVGIASLNLEKIPLDKITNSLSHRGPDDFGTWTNKRAGVGLGHRRLSIIDLSPSGRQHMESDDG